MQKGHSKNLWDITGRSFSQESGVKFQAESSEENEEVPVTTEYGTFSRERTQNLWSSSKVC